MGTLKHSGAASKPLAQQAEDAYLVKQHVLHTLVLDVLKRDSDRLARSPLKMAHVYAESLRQAEQEVKTDLQRIRQQFRRRGIKVFEEERQTHGVRVQYLCRGYNHSFYMLRGVLRAEVTNLMKRYLHLSSDEQQAEPASKE
ncbi:hypothetical protein [Paenibacillus marinisediminis]